MDFNYWDDVPLSTTWRQLHGYNVLIHADDNPNGIVASVHHAAAEMNPLQKELQREIQPDVNWANVRYSRTPDLATVTLLEMPLDRPVGPKVREFMGPSGRMVVVPPTRRDLRHSAHWAWIGVALVVAVLLFVFGGDVGAWLAVPAGLAVGWLARFAVSRPQPPSFLTAGEQRITALNIVEYVQRRELTGGSPVVLDEERRAAALRRVDEIKAEYGELLSDIVYRIDYPALFDTAVPTTQQFQVALSALDTMTNPSTADLEAMTNELEISYALARDHAETVGLRHLPEAAQAPARRAAKAARLAANAATDGERDASLAQVKRILESLALYYLPTVDEARLQIEDS